jgi:hypothetical protein
MIGAYCVRKLIDAGKTTDAVARLALPVLVYKARGKTVHLMNWHRVDELYDLERPEASTQPLRFVCNQIIHSYVYMHGIGRTGGLEFVLFCSDRERNARLFQASIDDLVNAFAAVAADEVMRSDAIWNGEHKDYDLRQA